jgi:hypothetical protein
MTEIIYPTIKYYLLINHVCVSIWIKNRTELLVNVIDNYFTERKLNSQNSTKFSDLTFIYHTHKFCRGNALLQDLNSKLQILEQICYQYANKLTPVRYNLCPKIHLSAISMLPYGSHVFEKSSKTSDRWAATAQERRASRGCSAGKRRLSCEACVQKMWQGVSVSQPKVTEYRSGCVRFTKIFILGLDYHIFPFCGALQEIRNITHNTYCTGVQYKDK